jgi:hypothetical protein
MIISKKCNKCGKLKHCSQTERTLRGLLLRCKDCKKEDERKEKNAKLGRYLRSRVCAVIKGINKPESAQILIGCNFKDARGHIEKQFTKGMTWDNHGMHGWHIDHIIPIASFDLSKPEQQRRAFHYTNMQPLWAKENMQKSDKMPDNHQEHLPI